MKTDNLHEKAVAELSNKINAWKQEAVDALDGKYGPAPKGEPEDYWRGRSNVLHELAAFLPTLGEDYVHVAELNDAKREIEQMKQTSGN